MKMNINQLTNFIEGCDDPEVIKTLAEKLAKAHEETLPSLRKFLENEDNLSFHFLGDDLKIAIRKEGE